jgi:hypothetical protein
MAVHSVTYSKSVSHRVCWATKMKSHVSMSCFPVTMHKDSTTIPNKFEQAIDRVSPRENDDDR